MIVSVLVTREQLSQSTDALHASQRPWVYVSAVEVNMNHPMDMLMRPDGSFDVDLSVFLKNSGTSVAVKGATIAYLYPGYGKGGAITFAANFAAGASSGTLVSPFDGFKGSDTNEEEIWNKECGETDKFQLDSSKSQPWQSGFTLVPGAETRHVQTTPNGGVTWSNMSTNHFLVFGCIGYYDGFNIQHHTRYCFIGRDKSPTGDGKAELVSCARSEIAD